MQPAAPAASLGRLTGANGGAGGRSAYLNASTPVADPNAKRAVNPLITMLPSALAAGASFIPGVGTVVAGGLGAIGEAAREDMSGENIDFGKIATEAGLSAVPFGLGKVGKLAKLAKGVDVTAKGLKTASTADKVATAAEDVAGAANATSKQSFIGKAGSDLSGAARGITPGAKVAGQDQLGVQGAGDLNGFLDSVGVKSASAKEQLAQLEQRHAVWGKQIGDTVAANNRSLNPTDLTAVKDRIAAKVGQIVGLPKTGAETALVGADGKAIITAGGDVANHPFIDSLYGDLGKVTDLKSLNAFRQKLDEQAINYGRNSNAPDPIKEQIAKAFRQGVSEHVGDAIPDLKPVQNLYGQSADAQDFLKAAAKSPGGVSIPFIGKVGGPAIQSAKAKLGAAANAASGATANVAEAGAPTSFIGKIGSAVKGVAQYGGNLAAQELTRGAADAVTGQPAAAAPGAPGGTSLTDPGAMAGGSATDPNAPAGLGSDQIDYTAAARKILSSGGDAKTQAAQLDLLAKVQAIESAGQKSSSTKPLSSAANQQVANATSGLQQLSVLEKELSAHPNAANLNAAASILPGAAGNVARGAAGTQDFQTSRGEIVDVLARLRTGAAISKSEEAQYKSMLPAAGDSPTTVAHKVAIYKELFQGILDRAQQGSPAVDLASVAN